jgi:hypothetical protein
MSRPSWTWPARLADIGLVVLAVAVGVLIVLALRDKAPPASAINTSQPSTPRTTTPAQTSPDPATTKPVALWIGDSYPLGTGAPKPYAAESCLAARAMGWACDRDTVPGTSFVAAGGAGKTTALPQRLKADKAKYSPDIVIVDAGRADAPPAASDGKTTTPLANASPAVETAAANELRGIHTDFPSAELVVIAPYFMSSANEPLGDGFVTFLRKTARRYGGEVIDPIGEGWISRATTAKLTTTGGIYPNAAGHHYIARHLVKDFRRLGLRTITGS